MRIPKVLQVSATNEYMLYLQFANGVLKAFDFKPLLAMPVYKPLRDPIRFQEVTVDQFGGVTWGNDIDCCRDTLYLEGHSVIDINQF